MPSSSAHNILFLLSTTPLSDLFGRNHCAHCTVNAPRRGRQLFHASNQTWFSYRLTAISCCCCTKKPTQSKHSLLIFTDFSVKSSEPRKHRTFARVTVSRRSSRPKCFWSDDLPSEKASTRDRFPGTRFDFLNPPATTVWDRLKLLTFVDLLCVVPCEDDGVRARVFSSAR